MGTKDKDGQARVHWASPGQEPGDGDKKEWKSLDELRPVPPDPPKGWLHRLQPLDVVNVCKSKKADCWEEACFEELILPEDDKSEPMYQVSGCALMPLPHIAHTHTHLPASHRTHTPSCLPTHCIHTYPFLSPTTHTHSRSLSPRHTPGDDGRQARVH